MIAAADMMAASTGPDREGTAAATSWVSGQRTAGAVSWKPAAMDLLNFR